ncbi:MAG: hypothetical protein KGS61_19670, partial [Verrucomicrobia bacterium]|nr:hypothetical protein [Verrucomicrobiota bacterium]
MKTGLLMGLGLLVAAILAWCWPTRPTRSPAKTRLAVSIQPRDLADALRAVIVADRDVYLREVIQPPAQDAHRTPAEFGPAAKSNLAAPCQLLRLGDEQVQNRGAEFSYAL